MTPDTTAADVLKMAVERFSPGDDGTATYALYLATDKSGEFVFILLKQDAHATVDELCRTVLARCDRSQSAS